MKTMNLQISSESEKEEKATEPLSIKKNSSKPKGEKENNNPSLSLEKNKGLVKHPTEIILKDIENKWAVFQKESQTTEKEFLILKNQLNHFGYTIEELKRKVNEQEKEKGSWLNILRSYWTREVTIIQLAQVILDGVAPSEREEAINKIVLANRENGKVEKNLRAKSTKEIKKSSNSWKWWVAGAIIVLAVIGGIYWIYNRKGGEITPINNE